jgi:hypothetical protein
VIQQAMANNTRPIATPDALLPPGQTPETRISDQIDPRFPHVDGPVRRFPQPPQVNLPPGHSVPPQAQPIETGGIAQPPDIMKVV